MLNKGDFHIHTIASDGTLNPTEVVLLAKKIGVDIIAITDHNTVLGVEEAIKAGKIYEVAIIPAIELSTRYRGEKIHLLGYFKNDSYKYIFFQDSLELIRTHKVSEARNKLKYFMTIDSTENYLSVTEGINFLKLFGATVVLAHPVRIKEKNLYSILNMPLDGIEAKYWLNSDTTTSFFMNIALEHFSYYTAGSDFHTNKKDDSKYRLLGTPNLNSSEIEVFLKKSNALVESK